MNMLFGPGIPSAIEIWTLLKTEQNSTVHLEQSDPLTVTAQHHRNQRAINLLCSIAKSYDYNTLQ